MTAWSLDEVAWALAPHQGRETAAISPHALKSLSFHGILQLTMLIALRCALLFARTTHPPPKVVNE